MRWVYSEVSMYRLVTFFAFPTSPVRIYNLTFYFSRCALCYCNCNKDLHVDYTRNSKDAPDLYVFCVPPIRDSMRIIPAGIL